jgi:hypothetical protein
MELKIYSKNGDLRTVIYPADNSRHQAGIRSEGSLSLSMTSQACVRLEPGDYADFLDMRFWLLEAYTPKQASCVEWAYDFKMYGVESIGKQALMLSSEGLPLEAFHAPAAGQLAMVVMNLNRWMGTTDWKAGECVVTENLDMDYSGGTYCSEALDKIADAAGTEWWMEGTTINITRAEHGAPLELGYGNGLLSIERDSADNVPFFTRMFPVGSPRNIDYIRYGNTRLQMPSGLKYAERNTDKYGVVERYEEDAFAHIFPRRTGYVSSVRTQGAVNGDGADFTIYYFSDSSLNFNPNDYELEGLVKHIVFQDGDLGGRDFEVNYSAETHEFEIINQYPYGDENQLPGGFLVPKSGDAYILYNIRMPDEYYPAAEAELAEAVNDFLNVHSEMTDRSVYKCATNYIDLDARGVRLAIGQRVRLVSDRFFPQTGYRDSRITSVTRSLERPNEADIEISDVISQTSQSAMQKSIAAVRNEFMEASTSIPDIIKSWETTMPTDTNLLSALATVRRIGAVASGFNDLIQNLLEQTYEKFLRKDIHDTAEEPITFLKGIEAFGESWMEDLRVSDNAFFDNTLSSPVFTSGFPGGTGWAIFWREFLNAAGVNEKKAAMEIDEITVRGVMRVYEFIISQLRGENGTTITSDMMRVHHIDTASKTVWLDTEKGLLYNPFRTGDILMVQQFSPTGDTVGIRKYELRVETASVGSLSDGEDRLDSITYSHFIGSESDVRARDVLTRVDSVTDPNRKGIIKSTSVENGAPYMDVLYGMKTDPDNALRARIGRLAGIITYLWGQLAGYGLYSDNAYLTGSFRLKTGEDVRTRFEIMEGKLQSAMQSVITTLNERDNYLRNATFQKDMEYWIRERDIVFYEAGDQLIDLGTDFFSEKNKIADVDSFDGRFMLRIKNSNVKQEAIYIRKPEEGDELWLTVKYCCIEGGHLTAGFAGTDLLIDADIEAGEGEFVKMEVSGIWDGTGDFTMSFTGDIYIETLALTTDPLENYRKEVSTLFEQTSEYITAKANALQYDINGILQTISTAGWITTADGMNIWATRTELNALGQTVSSQSSELVVLYNMIQTKVSQTDFNTLGQRVSSAESSITQLANSITLKVSQTDFNALGQRMSSAESSITQLGNSITSKVSQTDFNSLNQTVAGHTSSITQLANSITSKVSQTDFNALNQTVAGHTSSITQLANSITSVVSSVDAITGQEIISRINQTASSYTIQAKNINLNGVITANNTFRINTDGTMVATGGKIGGFTISGNWLTSTLLNGDSGAILMRDTSSGTVIGLGADLVPGTAGGSHTLTAQIVNRQKGIYETTALYLEAAGGSNSGDYGYETRYPMALETLGNVRIRGAFACCEEVAFVNNSDAIANPDGSLSSPKRIGVFGTYIFQPSTSIYVYLPKWSAIEGYFGYFTTGESTSFKSAITIRILVTRWASSSILVKVGGSDTAMTDHSGNEISGVEMNKGDVAEFTYHNGCWYLSSKNWN